MEDDSKTITVERPTGPRITATEPRSLGELVTYKAKSLASNTVTVAAASFALLTKYKFATAIGFSTVTAVATHLIIASMMMGMIGDTKPTISSNYQGPGDIVSTWTFWGSCARGFSNAKAIAHFNTCQVTDTASGLNNCTFHLTNSGFVDPTECNATACAVACVVITLYDQSGNGNDLAQGTRANAPDVSFSTLLSMPSMSCVGRSGGSCTLQSSATVTQTQPINMYGLWKSVQVSNDDGVVGINNDSVVKIGQRGGADQVQAGNGGVVENASSGSWHVVQGLLTASPNCIMNVDGSEGSAGDCGSTGMSGAALRCHRGDAGNNQDQANLLECGIYSNSSTAFNSTQRNNLSSNAHDATNGYNF